MKTENTLENKAAFFVQYWGQSVGMVYLEFGKQAIIEVYDNYIHEISLLELTPLLAITDKEIIEACKLGYPLAFAGNNKSEKWNVSRSEQGFSTVSTKYSSFKFEFDLEGAPFIDMYHEASWLSNAFNNVAVADYLRSKGYLIGWRDLSVQDLIEYGWAKEKH